MTGPGPIVSPELVAFLESGLTIVVGTRSAELVPEAAFAAGLRVHPGGRRVTLLLAALPAARTIENLRANGAVAVTASRPRDYRTLQLKGRAVRVAPVPDSERAAVLACREALAGQLEAVGWARGAVRRFTAWPCVAAEVELEAVYAQTPGPRAGSLLGGP